MRVLEPVVRLSKSPASSDASSGVLARRRPPTTSPSSRRMPEANTGDQNSHGSRVDEFGPQNTPGTIMPPFGRPGCALNRPTWSPVKGSSARVSPNRLSYGCPTTIFGDPRNRHRHHLSATLLDGRAGNGWAWLLRCGRDRLGDRDAPHSITSSELARSDGTTEMPSARAVFRLMTSTNLIGFWTGKSAG